MEWLLLDCQDERTAVSYGHRVLAEGKNGVGLVLRQAAQYIDVTTALRPLFAYMRWDSNRTRDELFRYSVDPTAIDRMKLFPPGGVPVTGPGALSGATGGPWDKLTIPVENHYLYQSIDSHLSHGTPWSETQIYDHPKYSDDPERARQRCAKIERIIESIREQGYKQQSALAEQPEQTQRPDREWIDDVYVGDEIIVGLGRNGRPIHLKNGRHRLAVAQVLDIDRIPVVLSIYHPRARAALPEERTVLSE